MVAKKVDTRIVKALEDIAAKRKEIREAEGGGWKTNCSFSSGFDGNGQGHTCNIQVESSIQRLLAILGHVLDAEERCRRAKAIIGYTGKFEFTWQGFRASDWASDIKTRINRIEIASKKKELMKLEEAVNKIMPEELRREIELASIESVLASL